MTVIRVCGLASALVAAASLVACGGGAAEKRAKQAVERDLRDPASVQYREVKEYQDGTVCGEFNAKNGMGGYVGFERFTLWEGRLLGSHRFDAALCTNEKDKATAIRRIEPTYMNDKEHQACIAAEARKPAPEATGRVSIQAAEARLRATCGDSSALR